MNYFTHYIRPTLSIIIGGIRWPVHLVFCPNTSNTNIASCGCPHMALKWFWTHSVVMLIDHIVAMSPTLIIITIFFGNVAFIVRIIGPGWELLHLRIIITIISTPSISTLLHSQLVPTFIGVTPLFPPVSTASISKLGALILLHLRWLIECWWCVWLLSDFLS